MQQQPPPSGLRQEPCHVAYGTDPYRVPGGQYVDVLWAQKGEQWAHHLDRERQKGERQRKEEQERVQREAVQQHFEESLRLASQKTRLIAQHPHQNHLDSTKTSCSKGNWSPKVSSSHGHPQAKWQQPRSVIPEVKGAKGEPSFNLYGYQPFPQMYITQAQLKAREESSLVQRDTPTDVVRPDSRSPALSPAPAHQGSISRCSLTQEEPENLVKRRQCNRAVYSYSLIQQGLVPNPLYSQTAQQSGYPGITSGTPVCRTLSSPALGGEPLNLEASLRACGSPTSPDKKPQSPTPSDSKQGSVQSDSDVTPSPSPAPSTCTTVSNSSSNHTKLKKAWLQRHSEIEKEAVSEVPRDSEDTTKEEGSEKTCKVPRKRATCDEDYRNKKVLKADSPKKDPKRRGRKPKRLLLVPQKKLARSTEKLTLVELKKSGKPFLQDGSCYDVAPKLPKCRECRMTPHQRNKKMPNIFCRFYAFRKLRYGKNGTMLSGGFSEPSDASEEDLQLWLPRIERVPKELEVDTAQIILSHVGDQFCDLVEQEREAQSLHMGQDKTISWKRVVQGVREMCDVCETTLFNIHWVCHKCGFVVCIDCYKAKKNGTVKAEEIPPKDRDEYQWLLCASRQAHEQERLMMTQIIAGNALWQVGQDLHRVRTEWDIPAHCGCRTFHCNKTPSNNGMCKQLMSAVSKCFAGEKEAINGKRRRSTEEGGSPLSVLADVALNSSNKLEEGDFSTLRELLVRPTGKKPSLDQVMSSALQPEEHQMTHFCRRFPSSPKGREPLAIRVCTLAESSLLYPKVPHSWLCNGKLLVLDEPHNKHNLAVFQEQWRRGQPVLVTDVCKNLNMDLWHPDGFCRDFGDVRNDLVNCRTGNILPNQPMRKFWEGFENFGKRMKDEDGEYMLLKLKDWPPGDDFSDMLPSRFSDLMKVLPLPEYTHRDGVLNLAGRLPDCFVRPDLGPKMYNAYGSALYPNKGTTNLHLDVSDAVNVMVYVGIPKDGKDEQHINEALKAVDEGACDMLTRKRVRENNAKPGALWHIYNARDADKIRDLLNKVAVERGEKLEPHHDPIHDQSWYLDNELRERLFREYAVEGYAIAQCLGEAVFIPAGAPHQVRNLHSCIKVAEDFVSPENIAHCLSLTNEFRQLSDNHTNHEDKLQIKNVIYHAVKDALVILRAHRASCK